MRGEKSSVGREPGDELLLVVAVAADASATKEDNDTAAVAFFMVRPGQMSQLKEQSVASMLQSCASQGYILRWPPGRAPEARQS